MGNGRPPSSVDAMRHDGGHIGSDGGPLAGQSDDDCVGRDRHRPRKVFYEVVV